MERVYQDRFSEKIRLQHPVETLKAVFDKRASGNLSLWIEESVKEVHLELEAREYSYVKVFVQNLNHNECSIILHSDVYRDAKIAFGLLDLEKGNLKTDLKGYLKEDGADLELYTGQLCLKDADKNNNVKILHETAHTFGNIHNFAVVFDEGRYFMAADGTIAKGCFDSESHQESRVLTMGSRHKAEVIPILYIDENDVKASHALTIGQPDAQQLYYLQSRGLSKEQAMGLLSIGYFMPVIDLVDDEDLHEKLRFEMEEKVGLYEHR